ncbi:MAG: tyrosine-protein phosphatase [Oscillospiraceae bacterium]|nr:tyrosine-protein phosphatase [Oscillospiraceae bacterium]
MKARRMIALLLAALLLTVLTGCSGSKKTVTTGNVDVLRDTEFGNVYLDLTIDEFNKKGFSFGDSIDVAFSNGYTLEDIPYYSGYYVPVGAALAVGYPGYPHVMIARNYGSPMWEETGAEESTKAVATLHEAGKYAPIQELYSLSYSDLREEYPSDIAFCNFRTFSGGELTEGRFYRSASPCDNTHQRAKLTDGLVEQAGIRCVMNLADSTEEMEGYRQAGDFDSPYYDALSAEGGVLFLNLNANYRDPNFAAVISRALLEMTEMEGPYLIHCQEGKDRTGFVCSLILALAGATREEIREDYMVTYANYYGITKEKTPEKYEAVLTFVDDFLYFVTDPNKQLLTESLSLEEGARDYLRYGGLTQEEVAKVEAFVRG